MSLELNMDLGFWRKDKAISLESVYPGALSSAPVCGEVPVAANPCFFTPRMPLSDSTISAGQYFAQSGAEQHQGLSGRLLPSSVQKEQSDTSTTQIRACEELRCLPPDGSSSFPSFLLASLLQQMCSGVGVDPERTFIVPFCASSSTAPSPSASGASAAVALRPNPVTGTPASTDSRPSADPPLHGLDLLPLNAAEVACDRFRTLQSLLPPNLSGSDGSVVLTQTTSGVAEHDGSSGTLSHSFSSSLSASPPHCLFPGKPGSCAAPCADSPVPPASTPPPNGPAFCTDKVGAWLPSYSCTSADATSRRCGGQKALALLQSPYQMAPSLYAALIQQQRHFVPQALKELGSYPHRLLPTLPSYAAVQDSAETDSLPATTSGLPHASASSSLDLFGVASAHGQAAGSVSCRAPVQGFSVNVCDDALSPTNPRSLLPASMEVHSTVADATSRAIGDTALDGETRAARCNGATKKAFCTLQSALSAEPFSFPVFTTVKQQDTAIPCQAFVTPVEVRYEDSSLGSEEGMLSGSSKSSSAMSSWLTHTAGHPLVHVSDDGWPTNTLADQPLLSPVTCQAGSCVALNAEEASEPTGGLMFDYQAGSPTGCSAGALPRFLEPLDPRMVASLGGFVVTDGGQPTSKNMGASVSPVAPMYRHPEFPYTPPPGCSQYARGHAFLTSDDLTRYAQQAKYGAVCLLPSASSLLHGDQHGSTAAGGGGGRDSAQQSLWPISASSLDRQSLVLSSRSADLSGSTSPVLVRLSDSAQQEDLRQGRTTAVAAESDAEDLGHDGVVLDESKQKKLRQCGICRKVFQRPYSLKVHMKVHVGRSMFRCPWPRCGRTFMQKSHLTVHHRLHTGDMLAVCSWSGCGKYFTRATDLTKHMRVHTGQKPYICVVCRAAFAQSNNAYSHVVGRHPKEKARFPESGIWYRFLVERE